MTRTMRCGLRDLLAIACVVPIIGCSRDASKGTLRTDTATAVVPAPVSDSTALASSSSDATGASASTFVGMHVSPLPPGVSVKGGSVIMGADGTPSAFSFSHVERAGHQYVWLDGADESASPNARDRLVRAQVELPPLIGAERLFIGSCDVDGTLDGTVVAIGDRVTKPAKATIRAAWRADTAAERFTPIPPKNVACEDPGG